MIQSHHEEMAVLTVVTAAAFISPLAAFRNSAHFKTLWCAERRVVLLFIVFLLPTATFSLSGLALSLNIKSDSAI